MGRGGIWGCEGVRLMAGVLWGGRGSRVAGVGEWVGVL